MDKTILNLLFNYKGTITYRECRVGTAILFMLAGTYLATMLNATLGNMIAGRVSMEWLAANSIYTQVTNSFTPTLVPAWFIVSYSSFVLATKRIRALSHPPAVGIASGIVNYLFFASLISSFCLGALMPDLAEQRTYLMFVTPALIYTILAFLAAGVANLIFLCFRRNSEEFDPEYPTRRLDASGYAIKLANLMAISAIVSVIAGICLDKLGYPLFDTFLYSPEIQYVFGLFGLVTLIFYITYSIYRLKDAQVSVLWLIGAMVIYLALFGFRIWLNMNFAQAPTAYFNTLFAMLSSFFVAVQYMLFLLPTKNGKE